MRAVTFALATLCLMRPACAIFMTPPLANVPIDRLIANAAEQVKRKPDDPHAHYVLARLHSMAATGTETAAADERSQAPYFGPEPQPGPMRHGVHAADNAAAKQHLADAIASYRAALERNADDLFSLMGLAWSYAEASRKEEAIASYRKAHDLAWKQESAKEDLYVGSSITMESGEALLQLLPADQHAEIRERMTAIQRKPMFVTPVMFPADGDARLGELVDATGTGVRFDLVGDGGQHRWRWVTPRAAFLVWDGDGTGRVTSGRQLFGNTTWWVMWRNGYEPLAALDDDRDGWLTGRELAGLAVWHDRDVDGISNAGEVRPLADWGITGVACAPSTSTDGCPAHPAGIRFRDGTTRPSFDWITSRVPD